MWIVRSKPMSRMHTGGTLPLVIAHANRQKDCVYWVEVHTADDKEVKVVSRQTALAAGMARGRR